MGHSKQPELVLIRIEKGADEKKIMDEYVILNNLLDLALEKKRRRQKGTG